jgi:hypothetical protein
VNCFAVWRGGWAGYRTDLRYRGSDLNAMLVQIRTARRLLEYIFDNY